MERGGEHDNAGCAVLLLLLQFAHDLQRVGLWKLRRIIRQHAR